MSIRSSAAFRATLPVTPKATWLCVISFAVLAACVLTGSAISQEPAPAAGNEKQVDEQPTDEKPTDEKPTAGKQPEANQAEEKKAIQPAPPIANAPTQSLAYAEPVVARMEMKLKLNDKVLDTIEKGDLLTVLSERTDAFVIQTFAGVKGAVAKVNVAKLAESAEIYDDLIKAAPEEGRLYTLRAGAYWAMASNEQALADFNKAIELGYNAGHAYSSRGLFYAAIGEYDKAIADYVVAIEKDPLDEVALVNRASVFMATGKYEEAIKDYDGCIKLSDKNPIYYQQRAIARKLMDKFDDAIADYDKSLELQPGNVTSWMGRGFIKFQLGRNQEAIDDFSKVIELAPGTAVAFNNRGYNYQLLKQYSKALTDYNEAIQLAPRYLLALQNRGWLLTTCEEPSLRNPQLAIESATAACEITEFRDPGDLMLLAAAHASKEQFEEAIGWQEKVLAVAEGVQKEIAQKVLELYQQKKPLDPKLLEIADAEAAGDAKAGDAVATEAKATEAKKKAEDKEPASNAAEADANRKT